MSWENSQRRLQALEAPVRKLILLQNKIRDTQLERDVLQNLSEAPPPAHRGPAPPTARPRPTRLETPPRHTY